MIVGLEPYAAVKDSGIEWLGVVPSYWQVRRLKTLCSRSALYGANVSADSYVSTGVRFLRTTDINDHGQLVGRGVFLPERLVDDYLLSDGDLLVSRSGTVGRSLLYEGKVHGVCAYAGYLVRFTPGSELLPRYLFLFTKTQAFDRFLRTMAISSTIENVNGEKYANCPLPLPPFPEQAAIARFLDHTDRRLQRYIRAKEKLIALLEEQKQAVIHQAVTGQIDVRTGKPYRAYKDSGVERLGRVPEHWGISRLKGAMLQPLQNGIFKKKDQFGDGVPLINVADIYRPDFRIDPGSLERVRASTDEIRRFRVEPRDVFFVRSSLKLEGTGRSAIVGDCLPGTVFECHLVKARSDPREIDARLLVAHLNCYAIRHWLISRANVVTMATIAQNTISSCPILLPPLPEQSNVIRFIDAKTTTIDHAVANHHRQVGQIREYRARLISDVVTGKLDICEAAVHLPDIDPLKGDNPFEVPDVEPSLSDIETESSVEVAP